MHIVMADFFGNTMMNLVFSGSMPPSPTTKWEILSETSDGDIVAFHVRYSNDTETIDLQTRWQHVAGEWKIGKATKIGPNAEIMRRADDPSIEQLRRAGMARLRHAVSTDREALAVLLGLLPDREMTAARAREGLAVPVAPSIVQSHPGEASHEIQL